MTADPCSKIRVLIVDDDQMFREALEMCLTLEPGIAIVAQASDGSMALPLAREHRPDVILMDVLMPGLDGIEATRMLTHELPGIRVIGLSMHLRSDIGEELMQAGAAAYVSKSDAIETLLDTIRQGCPK